MQPTFTYLVYAPSGQPTCGTIHGEDAAAAVALLGDGAKIADERTGAILWTEGQEKYSATESYDYVADIVWTRLGVAKRARRRDELEEKCWDLVAKLDALRKDVDVVTADLKRSRDEWKTLVATTDAAADAANDAAKKATS